MIELVTTGGIPICVNLSAIDVLVGEMRGDTIILHMPSGLTYTVINRVHEDPEGKFDGVSYTDAEYIRRRMSQWGTV